jgi:cytochrome c peroxidase
MPRTDLAMTARRHRTVARAAGLLSRVLTLLLVPFAATAQDLPRPVDDSMYVATRPEEVALGRLLFWDPILSGNRNISCGTCHHPRFGTSDGVSLGLGEGGIGLGPERRADPANPPEQRLPRNASSLFNLGASEFTVLFHDGRVEADPTRPSGLRTPLEDEMVAGFSGVLSAQTMFPVLSQDEMAGHYAENEVAAAARQGLITGPGGAWDLIARRVAGIDGYARAFAAVYPHVAAGAPIAFTDISNAIAAFIADEWRSDDSPFDAHLRGEATLTGAAAEGMALFYGAAGCAGCHAGPFLTDHRFHATGQVQIGPGKAARFERHRRDEGRLRVTGRPEDAYAFRTPSLRNVALTAPYGHAGAFATLGSFLRHHADPARDYVPEAILPPLAGADDYAPLGDGAETASIRAAARQVPALAEADIAPLVAFLESLTGATAQGSEPPEAVPSGLPVDR